MSWIWLASITLAFVLVTLVVLKAVRTYRSTPWTTALLSAFEDSATIALCEISKAAGGVFYLLVTYGETLTDPTLASALAAVGVPAKAIALTTAFLGFAYSTARRRTL